MINICKLRHSIQGAEDEGLSFTFPPSAFISDESKGAVEPSEPLTGDLNSFLNKSTVSHSVRSSNIASSDPPNQPQNLLKRKNFFNLKLPSFKRFKPGTTSNVPAPIQQTVRYNLNSLIF